MNKDLLAFILNFCEYYNLLEESLNILSKEIGTEFNQNKKEVKYLSQINGTTFEEELKYKIEDLKNLYYLHELCSKQENVTNK